MPELDFGAELRQRRHDAGLSLEALGKRANLTAGYLSKIENAHRIPPPETARQLDRALHAGGALFARLPRPGTPADADPMAAVSTEAPPAGPVLKVPSRFDAALMGNDLSLLLTQLHRLGHSAAPVFVLPFAHELVSTARSAAEATGRSERGPLLTVAACAAEYAGWMAQEGGNMLAAGWWTDQAVILADLAGDPHLAAYASLRVADFALYQGNQIGVVEHARKAQANAGTPVKTRHLAALREAQGHALAVDDWACRDALDRAAAMAREAAADSETPYGPVDVSYFQGVVTGWCLYDLGRYRQATEEFDVALKRIPPGSHRALALYGARAANAHLAAGQLDEACDVGQRALAQARQTASVSARTELRRLHERLAHRSYPAARTLRGELAVLLHEFG